MKCPQCSQEIRGRALFCPKCGHKLDQPPPIAGDSGPGLGSAGDEKERRGCSQTFLVLAIAAVVVLILAGVGVAAVYFGLADRGKVQTELAEEHYDKGNAHLAQGELELAIAEYELVLQLNPKHTGAKAKLAEAREKLQAVPTSTPALQEETKSALMAEIREAYARHDWQGVLDAADRLLALDPEYHRGDVDQLLFEAFYQSGLILVDEGRMEEALRLFDRALALQPDNVQVQHAKNLATLYTEAMGYWGADWAQTTASLQKLYRLAPDYRDVRDRLFEARVQYGDFLAEGNDWCGASEQYAQALDIRAEAVVAAKRQNATTRCTVRVSPTPVPGRTPVPTGPVGPSGPPGTYVGQLVERTGLESRKMFVRGKVINKAAQPLRGSEFEGWAWDWSAIAVTNGEGQYSFDGLSNPVTYTLKLLDLPSVPYDVLGMWGKISWVEFRETP